MPVKFKVDILAALKAAGYSTYKIRKENIFAQYTVTQMRQGELVSWAVLGRLCELLKCQPGDLLEYVPNQEESAEVNSCE